MTDGVGAIAEHREYIASEKWRTRRGDYLAKYPYCAECGLPRRFSKALYGEDLHVHHVSYARVGEELDEDLQTLCKRDHEVKSFGHSSLKSYEYAKAKWRTVDGAVFLLSSLYDMPLDEEWFETFRKLIPLQDLTATEADLLVTELLRTLDRWPNLIEWCEAAIRIKQYGLVHP